MYCLYITTNAIVNAFAITPTIATSTIAADTATYITISAITTSITNTIDYFTDTTAKITTLCYFC